MLSSIVLTKVIQKIKTRLFEFDKVIIVRPISERLWSKDHAYNYVAFLIIRRQMR